MFVDSDDWLDTNMVKTMMEYSYKYDADIVQSAFYYAYDNKLLIDNRYQKQSSEPIRLDNDTLMYELVKNEKVKKFSLGKLYNKEIIIDIFYKLRILIDYDMY